MYPAFLLTKERVILHSIFSLGLILDDSDA